MVRLTAVAVACLLLAVSAQAANEPTLGGAPGMDITCVPMPESPAGHFVCEDPDSFRRCKALEGKSKVNVEGEKNAIPVLLCQQGG